MSGQQAQQAEPTMDEILASIREIISDDVQRGKLGKLTNLPSVNKDEGILELTNMVSDDGRIISLKRRQDQIAANSYKAVADDIEKTDNQKLDQENFQLPDVENEIKGAKEFKENKKNDLANRELALGDSKEANETSEESLELISSDTAKKSVEALKVLSSFSNRDGSYDFKKVGNLTIEALLRELLRPMLKEWIDAYLPSLVKWLVAEQIEKMIKNQNISTQQKNSEGSKEAQYSQLKS